MNNIEGFESESDSQFSGTLRLDPRIYTREAILKACHSHTNVAYIHVPESLDGKITIVVRLKNSTATLQNPRPSTITEFIGEFCNSLLEFELRRLVEEQTSTVRQLILAKAFSESGVLEEEPPGSVADPVEVAAQVRWCN